MLALVGSSGAYVVRIGTDWQRRMPPKLAHEQAAVISTMNGLPGTRRVLYSTVPCWSSRCVGSIRVLCEYFVPLD
jgi:hypothetical protein